MAAAKFMTAHDEIKNWIEAQNAHPATVRGTEDASGAGLLRVDFPDGEEPNLMEISWEEFFQKFDESELAFLYQDEPGSRICKFVSRATVERHMPAVRKAAGGARGSTARKTATRKTAARKPGTARASKSKVARDTRTQARSSRDRARQH